ncbi:N-acetylglucosamine-6-phosphate deacetylase [Microbulbifer sp. 2304DJ12-6]|uniref:N-acetylglucosamine-6-phosphate deacetylase n=1 Tax=Microbulbifer sp. 2304DJ12-6 TaxID=3233340 RepID=UPI0039AF4406
MFALYCEKIFDGEVWLQDHAVLVQGGNVSALLPGNAVPTKVQTQVLEEGYLVPGFVDLQVNGGGGLMLNSAPALATVECMARAHRGRGTTALLPTVISDRRAVYAAAVEAVVAARAAGHSGILGLHIEGPFFAPARRGAHRKEMIRQISCGDIAWLCEQARRLPLLLTLAPERCTPEQIRQLSEAGIRVCAGHSEASFDQVQAALQAGLSGFTHLYNAMSPLTAREPGMVGAALADENSWVGIIADGHHVHAASLKVAHRAKAAGRLYLVSDAMATVGAAEAVFEIYGESIRERGGRLVNREGSLAGSAIGLADAVRYCHREVGLPLAECLRMASLYPASFLGLQDSLGRLAAGVPANLTWLDGGLQVRKTWLAGDARNHPPNP